MRWHSGSRTRFEIGVHDGIRTGIKVKTEFLDEVQGQDKDSRLRSGTGFKTRVWVRFQEGVGSGFETGSRLGFEKGSRSGFRTGVGVRF